MSGTEEPVKLSDCHTNCTCMHQSKCQPLPAVREEEPGLLTLNKFRSRCERGRFTHRRCSHAALLPLNLAGLRRGLASYRFRLWQRLQILFFKAAMKLL